MALLGAAQQLVGALQALAGSGSLVGIGTTIIEIRLPQVPRSSRRRTDIGIIATSGSSGSASRSSSHSRTAPAHSVDDDVVDRDAELAPDLAHGVERERPEREPAVRGDRPVERRPGRRAPSSPRGCPWTRRTRASGAPASRRARASARRAARSRPEVGEACTVRGSERSARSGWRGSPRRPRSSISRSRGIVAGSAAAGAGSTPRPSGSGSSTTPMISFPLSPSTTEWWILRQHRHAPALEPVDDVDLPQRPAAVERAAEHALHGLGELTVVARRGQRRLADVELEVEVRVLDPVRQVQAQRHRHEPPAQRREQVQARFQQRLDLGPAEHAARRGARVVDAQEGDVSVDPRRFDVEELRVEAAQLPHAVQLMRKCVSVSLRPAAGRGTRSGAPCACAS